MCPLLDKYENRGYIAGKLEGKNQGENEGKIEGKIESILELLSDLGAVPQEVLERILAERDLQTMSSWHKSSAHADSIPEFRSLTGI